MTTSTLSFFWFWFNLLSVVKISKASLSYSFLSEVASKLKTPPPVLFAAPTHLPLLSRSLFFGFLHLLATCNDQGSRGGAIGRCTTIRKALAARPTREGESGCGSRRRRRDGEAESGPFHVAADLRLPLQEGERGRLLGDEGDEASPEAQETGQEHRQVSPGTNDESYSSPAPPPRTYKLFYRGVIVGWVQYCFPGMWLSDLTRGRYEVKEKMRVRKVFFRTFPILIDILHYYSTFHIRNSDRRENQIGLFRCCIISLS